jgi:hypothetical protein
MPGFPPLSPFDPGESPFHVRGQIYFQTHQYFLKKMGGMEPVYREIGDPKLLAFMRQEFDPDAWYDVLPVAQLIRAEARAMSDSVPEYLRHRARHQFDADIHGWQRLVLKVVSPERVARRLNDVVAQLFDFGETSFEKIGPGHVRSSMSGFPSILSEWYLNAFNVYAETALRAAGARHCTCRLEPPTPEGELHGVALVKLKNDFVFG